MLIKLFLVDVNFLLLNIECMYVSFEENGRCRKEGVYLFNNIY